MTGYELIKRINKMAKSPVQYRANWKKPAERIAGQVEDIISRLRAFANHHKEGCVADRCNSVAADLEAKLQESMAQF